MPRLGRIFFGVGGNMSTCFPRAGLWGERRRKNTEPHCSCALSEPGPVGGPVSQEGSVGVGSPASHQGPGIVGTEDHSLGGFSHRRVFSQLGGWKSKVRGSSGLAPPEAALLGLRGHPLPVSSDAVRGHVAGSGDKSPIKPKDRLSCFCKAVWTRGQGH